MHDFFARQEDARRQSGRLLVFFGLAVVGVALAVYSATALATMLHAVPERLPFWRPQLFVGTTSTTFLLIAACSFWKISELREGGAGIAAALGARLVSPRTDDPRERMLRNVVEEMSIASGVPVPDVYLLERERGINAFAAGYGTDDTVLCVTCGTLELLTRDELQGVVAHEFSHILNGDVLLNIRLLGWLNGILVVSQAGEIMLRGMRGSRGRNVGMIALAAVTLYVIGYVGYFFGQLIKSAVSRQREYLGDASAVQFTRNPGGLAGALKKIGGLAQGSRLDHPRAAEISHMFFGNGLTESWLHALDSHPPLPDRIRRLEPQFDGLFTMVEPVPLPAVEAPAVMARRQPQPGTSSSVLSGAAVMALLESVGDPLREHLHVARRLLSNLSPELLAATRDPHQATLLVYALLLDNDPAVRERQKQMVPPSAGDAGAGLDRLASLMGNLAREVRLPLLDLALPALRSLTSDQYRQLQSTVEALTAADGKMNVFEFTLRYLLLRHLAPRFAPRPFPPIGIYGIRGVQQECSCILTAMARVGHRDEATAQEAFARAVPVLYEQKSAYVYVPATECGMAALEKAFEKLEGASLQIKRRLLAACLQCLLHDEVVKGEEVELFRAVADAIGCPVPPSLSTASSLAADAACTAGLTSSAKTSIAAGSSLL